MNREYIDILNDLDPDVMTGFLEGYADRLDSEGSNKILVLDILTHMTVEMNTGRFPLGKQEDMMVHPTIIGMDGDCLVRIMMK